MFLKDKKKLAYIAIGILFLSILIVELTLTCRVFHITYNKDKQLIIEQNNYNNRQRLIRHKVSSECILLHNYIIKNTGISLSNLNVRIMKFLKEERTPEEYQKMLESVVETLNETNLLLDKYNENDHQENDKSTKDQIQEIVDPTPSE